MSYTLDERTGRVWRGDGALVPTQEPEHPHTIEWAAWIAGGGQYSSVIVSAEPTLSLTHLAFRRRFTLAERIAIDNAPDSGMLPAEVAAALRTMAKDMELAQEINLNDEDVIAGVQFLVQLGLLTTARAAEILATE
jgi:hypothetical protein